MCLKIKLYIAEIWFKYLKNNYTNNKNTYNIKMVNVLVFKIPFSISPTVISTSLVLLIYLYSVAL